MYLIHHGILKQKWGVRNGPPYPLGGGQYSKAEKKAIYKKRLLKNGIYNKRHFDKVLSKKDTTLTTLSYDKNRTKNVDMFFAAHDKVDKHQYNAMFNKPIPKDILDKHGNKIGTGQCLKWRINNGISNDIKVASEDSGAKVFGELYSKDRDFYNFVTDQTRMMSLYPEDKYLFKGYKESMDTIKKLNNNPHYRPTEKDIQTMYRLFNYTIPNDGSGNQRVAKDVLTQRTKFFNELKKNGYGAVLDVNDSIYGGFKAHSPVIVFDMESVFLKNVEQTKMNEKRFSELVTIGNKALLGGQL